MIKPSHKPAPLWTRVILWGAALLWMAVIFGFSAQSGPTSGQLSEKVAAEAVKIVTGEDYYQLPSAQQNWVQFLIRKGAHFSEYALLGILVAGCICAQGWPNKVYALGALFTLLYAAGDEWHQSFTPGRGPALRDVMIDFSGALVGLGLFLLAVYLARRRRDKRQKAVLPAGEKAGGA